MAGGCFTDVVPHSLKNYRQERAIEQRRLRKEIVATCVPECLSFREISKQ
jgi:hypothetical protein